MGRRHPAEASGGGAAAAKACIDARTGDGWERPFSPLILPSLPGYWNPTPPANSPAMFTKLRRGFAIKNARAQPAPATWAPAMATWVHGAPAAPSAHRKVQRESCVHVVMQEVQRGARRIREVGDFAWRAAAGCNQVQGATATMAFTAIPATWFL